MGILSILYIFKEENIMSILQFTNSTKEGIACRNLANRRIVGDIIRLTFKDGSVCECKLIDWNKLGFDAPIILGYHS